MYASESVRVCVHVASRNFLVRGGVLSMSATLSSLPRYGRVRVQPKSQEEAKIAPTPLSVFSQDFHLRYREIIFAQGMSRVSVASSPVQPGKGLKNRA